ncbi:hypothetical protein I4U23_027302 [Adineta vaga]|nr:hypothetical protein I4U23_027302 [Adineta vaga]
MDLTAGTRSEPSTQQTPDAWAILSSTESLTYKQLMNRVYSLAYHLQQQGGQPNQLIAILMRKGWEQVVACLAILVAGAAYLPLDIDSPQDRLCALIEETNVKIILTQSHCHHAIPHLVTIPVDTFTFDDYPKPFPIRQQQLTDLAYVIYTSGSTGKPKGVMISHQAVLNTILDINTRLNLTSNDRIFALSHLNFDLSVYDIFGMLIAGGTIVIPDHEHYRNPQHWYDMMVQHHVTIWNSVPMLMQMLVEHLQHTSNYNQLRHVLLSGDWIPLSLPKSIQTIFGEEVTITSLGGATEASIWSIAFTLPKEIPQEWKSIPYGMPLRNQQYYVYDTNLDDCPEWVDGELYIGGIGVADGYWNDEEKTRSSFIIHPQNGQRLYRTGDYGRFHPDGYIEFIGRKDFQVKIHGHRIELGEIEYHLQQHSDIHQAIVTVDKSSQYLIGYIMPEKYFISNDDFDQSNILITDPIDRTNFKLARHGIQHDHEVKKSYALTKPKLTETFINTYYARKSYRQFTNEIIEKSTIEHLLNKCCLTKKNVNQRFLQSFNFDNLSQLLSILTPINIYNHPLPKYRYASAGSLYPVQVYIELHTSIDDISPGIYYHNPDTHTLELIDNCVHDENLGIRLHLVGRSSAIAPLYGKTLGCQFCIIETGYMMGLLQQEASKLGFIFSRFMHNEEIDGHIINLDENDTHHCFTISSVQQDIANDSDYLQYIVYLKSVDYNKDQWFIYDKKDSTLISFDIELDVIKEDHGLQAGMTSHLLMDGGLEMNIGMCPIGTRTNLPIRDEQKYERAISTVKSTPDYIDTLRTYLRENLPSYMIPSYFMTLSTFPLSPNGKIDRKSLPEISTFDLQKEDTYIAPTTELEKTIADIWQELFDRDRISLTDNFFELGGNSLHIMHLFRRYMSDFYLETDRFAILDLFEYPTIINHAELIYQNLQHKENVNDYSWRALHLTQALASFAQERIFMDETIRFASKTNRNMYAIPLFYRLSSAHNHISTYRFHHAFETVVRKHSILRTERLMDMTLSREFWLSQLQGYNMKHSLPLLIDQHRFSTDQRSGLAFRNQIIFDDEITSSFINYASRHHLTLFQLGLAIFYVFLFKLSHGQTDLCITTVNANRYRNELQKMIGMFVSTLPYRIHLHPYSSLDESVKYIQEKCLSILEHSHYPLQRILTDSHLNQSNTPFLETMLDFVTVSLDINQLSFDGAPLKETEECY